MQSNTDDKAREDDDKAREDDENMKPDDDPNYFVNSEGKRISTKYWYPANQDKELRALAFLCHGAGEHCHKYYDGIANALNKESILAFAHDHVGHGLSEGDRVHLTTFDTFMNDVLQHVNTVKEKHPGLPCYIVGHSMGGTIAIKTGLDHPELFAGIVLIAPAISVSRETATPFKIFLAKITASILPQLQIGPIRPEWISRDPEIVKQYIEDPLVWHGGLKAKFSVIMLNTMEEIQRRVSEIKWPFFLLHGTHDKLCTLEGSQMLHDKASSKNKTLKVYEGAFHQVHNEPEGQGEEAIADIVDWITRV